jgi:hypothetical protein
MPEQRSILFDAPSLGTKSARHITNHRRQMICSPETLEFMCKVPRAALASNFGGEQLIHVLG